MAKPFSILAVETIAAPPERVFELMNDLGRLDEWSPFAQMDPNITTMVSDPAVGVGASYEWAGKRVGTGRMRIVRSQPSTEIDLAMEFLAPMASTSQVDYRLEPVAGGTMVTWRMSGERGVGGRIVAGLLRMDAMMAGNFADGLRSLKALAEAA